MIDRIRVGTMLIAEGTLTPQSLVVGTESYSAGWSSITKFTSAELGTALEGAGWTFFYMANEVRTTGFGFSDYARTSRAVAHVISAVKQEHCNCLEITQMRRRSFLGLSYTSLVAHARHIQVSPRFHDPSYMAATIPFSSPELHEEPATVRSKSLFAGDALQAWENEGGSRA
ncbi:MAG TPA: hypothetical protein VFA90_06180 [Terriglobales bacterium]|jgi:hypothetical protein|nr:hypothetical protein [Terriglobales bacterium]